MLFAASLFLILLLYLSWRGVRSYYVSAAGQILGTFIVAWTSLVLSGHALSLIKALDRSVPYLALTLCIAAGFSFVLVRISPRRALSTTTFDPGLPPYFETLLWRVLLGSLGFAVVVNLLIALTVLPSNPDSIVYRFPRVSWYYGSGSLMHFTNSAEPRPLYYPLNAVLAFLPNVHFQLGARSFSFLSLVCWGMSGVATYGLARDFGARRLYAFATAWLLLMTPNPLIQALSTNDEIIAAAPMLAGTFFLHRWLIRRAHFDFVLGVLAVGLSMGTKLHVFFYWPFLLCIAAVLVWHMREVIAEIRSWRPPRVAAVLGGTAACFVVLAFGFFAYNYASAGRLSAWELNAQVLNTPFSIRAALQTTALYVAQIVLTPVADLVVALAPHSRGPFYVAFNAATMPLFGWVSNDPAYTSAFYRFTGVMSPSSVVFNEQTVFIGFTWLAGLVAAYGLWRCRTGQPTLWPKLQLLSFAAWFLAYSASMRYIEGVTVYLTYALVIAAPALVFAFAPITNRRMNAVRWSILAFVGATTIYFALGVLITNTSRNVRMALKPQNWPVSPGFRIDETAARELGFPHKVMESHTIAWGQPHWAFMTANPNARQTLTSSPAVIPADPSELANESAGELRYARYVLMPRPGERNLHVYSFPKFPAYGHAVPIRIPTKADAGLTLIGNIDFALGPEWIFAAGDDVEKRHAGQDKYIVLPFQELSDFGRIPDPIVRFSSTVYGLGWRDDLEFSFVTKRDGTVVDTSPWRPTPTADLVTKGRSGTNYSVVVQVRLRADPERTYRQEVVLGATKALEVSAAPDINPASKP